jgi:hypothetical protein
MTLADAVLLPEFGSLVVELTDTVSVMVEPGVAVALTVTTKVKVAVALAARLEMVQV